MKKAPVKGSVKRKTTAKKANPTKRLMIIFGTAILLFFVMQLIIQGKFGEKISAARSIREVRENLYTMEYKGDYGFDQYLKEGGGDSADKMAKYLTNFLSGGLYSGDVSRKEPASAYACSALSVRDEKGQPLFGRNYDWQPCMSMMVHTKPDNGYESVSTACLDFLGFGENWKPEALMNKLMALAAIYIPVDGMNEKGLVVADLMAGDEEETHQDQGKADITTTAGIRLMLDHAATTDEAVELLRQYDMHSDIHTAHHYIISDASGKTVTVEYVGNEMLVTETAVLTNHYLSEGEKKGVGSENSRERYEKLLSVREENAGVMDMEAVKNALMSVAQSQMGEKEQVTQWSCVYDQKNLTVKFYWAEDYENPFTLQLKDDLWVR